MRYICLVAILIALPVTADAQQRVAAGRGNQPVPAPAASPFTPRSGEPNVQRRAPPSRSAPVRATSASARAAAPDELASARSAWAQPDRLAARGGYAPWWEQRRTPAWEQQADAVSGNGSRRRHGSVRRSIHGCRNEPVARRMLERGARRAAPRQKARPGHPDLPAGASAARRSLRAAAVRLFPFDHATATASRVLR